MNLFRISVIVLTLATVGAYRVHLRWQNAHDGYLIVKQYQRHSQLRQKYHEKRLDLSALQSPQELLDQLKRWEFPLQGWVSPETQPKKRVRP